MAETNAFRTALTNRCTLNNAAVAFFLRTMGISSAEGLHQGTDDSFESSLLHVVNEARAENQRLRQDYMAELKEYRRAQAAHAQAGDQAAAPIAPNAPTMIEFPARSIDKIRAFRLWSYSKHLMGDAIRSGDFTVENLNTYSDRRKELKMREDMKDRQIELPKLTSIGKDWRKFERQLRASLQQDLGAAKIPLIYLIREHEEVTPAIKNARYAEEDDRLIACVALSGSHYRIDNSFLADKIVSLVQDGECHGFINSPLMAGDGRAMFFELRRQVQGASHQLQTYQKAMSRLRSMHYNGKSRSYTLTKHIGNHMDCYHEILAAGRRIEATQRVTFLIDSIDDPKLQFPINLIRSSAELMSDFDKAKAQITDFAVTAINVGDSSSKRNIAQISQSGKGRNSSGKSKTKRIKEGDYFSYKEYQDLSKKEQQELRAARAKKGGDKTSNATYDGRFIKEIASAVAEGVKRVTFSADTKPANNETDSPPKKTAPSGQGGSVMGRAGSGKGPRKNDWRWFVSNAGFML